MLKRYLIIGAIPLILLIWVGGMYFATQKVSQLIEQANQDGNELSIKDWSLSFRFLTAGIDADSITLNQQVGNRQLSGKINHLEVSGVKVISLLFDDYPKINRLILNRPELRLGPAKMKADSQQVKDSTATAPLLSFYEVQINDGSLVYSKTMEAPTAFIYGINATQRDLILPFASEDISGLQLGLDSIHFPMPASEADWWLRGVEVVDQQALKIGKITLEPRSTPVSYLDGLTTLGTWNALRIDSLTTSKLDLLTFFREDSISRLERIDAQSLAFIVYEKPDLPRPDNEKEKPFPVEQLRQLPVQLSIGTLNIPSVDITYGIVSDKLQDRKLEFTKGSLSFTNLSTLQQSSPAVADLNIKFDGSTPLQAKFTFDQSEASGRRFSIQGTMGEYDLVKINPLMVVAADATIDNGQIHEIDYQAEFDKEIIRGEMMFRYSNLQLHLEGDGSWFKNLFKGIAVKKNNPQEDGDLRKGNIYVEHNPKRSFFNAYWKSIVSGLQSTAVGNLFNSDELDAEKVEGDKQRKKEKKRQSKGN